MSSKPRSANDNGQVISRHRLVQESDDSDSSRENTEPSQEVINNERIETKEEKRRALNELVSKRKITEDHTAKSVAKRDSGSKSEVAREKNPVHKRKSETKKPSKAQKYKKSRQDLKPQLLRSLKGLIASAALSRDPNFTRKRCREQLVEKFGPEQIDSNMDFFREEFDKLKEYCMKATPDDLRSMAAASAEIKDNIEEDGDDDDVSSDLDKPLKSGTKEIRKGDKKPLLTSHSKPSKKDFKSQLSLTLKERIAAAALSKNDSFTKKRCREQMIEVFGAEKIERNIELFREEFDKISKKCLNASEDDLRRMAAGADFSKGEDGTDSSSDLDKPLQSKSSHKKNSDVKGNIKASRQHKTQNAIAKTKITAGECLKGRKEIYRVCLERMIAASSLAQDRTLTKRTCRERLSTDIGFDIPPSDIEFVNREIDRITADCVNKEQASINLMAEQAAPQNITLYFSSVGENQSDTDALETDKGDSDNKVSDEESDSDASDLPSLSRRSKSRVKGILSGVIIAPCGKELLQNESALKTLRDFVESNGGKLQSCVTRKVQYVVVANGTYLKKNDSRVTSARKHGAKLVYESFFQECVRQQSMINWTDHAAVHTDSHVSATKKAKTVKSTKDKNQDEFGAGHNPEIDNENDDSSHPVEAEDNDNIAEKKSRRIAARKSKEDNEWTRDVKARFSYVKDARSRAYDPKDPVVSEATFVTDKGVLYNTYLTHTEFDEGDEGLTKFFAIKLVEAGGLMKGERWHLVTQWGKVGANKPGCDVTDFDDFKSALDAFKQRFWDKTRNSWDSSSFAFRTVSGKYTMEELSDDDGDCTSSEDENESPSQLDPRIMGLISNIFSTKSVDRILEDLDVDTGKLGVQKLKGNMIRESYAELVSIQKILQHGTKRSEKETQRLRDHTDRIVRLLHLKVEDMAVPLIDSVNALQEKTRLVNEIRSVLVLKSSKKRFLSILSASKNRIDTLYSGLRCHIDVVTASSDQRRFISKMFLGTAFTERSRLPHNLTNVFSVKRAGEDWRYAGFSQLDNKMLLWHAVRASTLVSILLQGMTTSPPETPAVGYPLGKGLYFYDSAAEAVVASGISQFKGPVFLILCEVALGNIQEVIRPTYLRRAPHGYHSVVGKGTSSFDPTQRVQFLGESGLYSIVGSPQESFGSSGSVFNCNQYVVYDVGQVIMEFEVFSKFNE